MARGLKSGEVVTPAHARNVLVYAYWPADAHHPSYGFGVDRRLFLAQPVVLVIVLLVTIPLMLTGMERAAWVISLLGAVVVGLLVFLDARSPYHGWYEVDADGKPIRFVSRDRPSDLGNQRAVRPKTFRRKVRSGS